jgi:hypothetical protein
LAAAAVHAGVLQPGQVGVVRVTMMRGPARFTGSSRHGVTSYDWDNTGGYYAAYRLSPIATYSTLLPTTNGESPADTVWVTPRGSRTYTHTVVPNPNVETLTLTAVASADVETDSIAAHRGQIGKALYVQATGRGDGYVWGTDVYTDDSNLGAAAVHAGVLGVGEKGVVKVTILPGRQAYSGTTRNGVESLEYGAFGGSYQVERNDRPQ